jgi:hypothetical protein
MPKVNTYIVARSTVPPITVFRYVDAGPTVVTLDCWHIEDLVVS